MTGVSQEMICAYTQNDMSTNLALLRQETTSFVSAEYQPSCVKRSLHIKTAYLIVFAGIISTKEMKNHCRSVKRERREGRKPCQPFKVERPSKQPLDGLQLQ